MDIENTHDLCSTYWKQAVKDYISCYADERVVTEKQLDKVVQMLIKDDELWNIIDSMIEEALRVVIGDDWKER